MTSLRAEDCNMPVTLGYSALNGVLQMADEDRAVAGRYYELIGKRSGVPAAADLASVRRPIRELRTAEKPVSRRRDAGS